MTVRDLVLAAGGAASYTPTYIEEVFSTYVYTGNGGNQLFENGLALNTQSEQLFEKPGTYTWICPAGVTSVSVVCIGGGGNERENGSGAYYGGAGGGLGYKNNITVTPGTAYTVIVGAAEGSSEFKLSTTGLVGASGGVGQSTRGAPLHGSSGGLGGYGGGDNIGDYSGGGGGGGAGGYTGNGGDGGAYGGSGPTQGTGGGYGGNAGGYGGGGYGMNVYGPAAQQTPSNPYYGGSYGGGSPGSDSYSNGGGTGAVRIIWPGTTRQFPSTSVEQGTTSKGGITWIKNRSGSTTHNHVFAIDTPSISAAFRNTYMSTNNGYAYAASTTTVPFFTGNGFQIGSDIQVNTSGTNYSSWSFKQQPKFLDIVQFNTSIVYDPDTGEVIGGGNATVSHNLQSVPGFIMVRRLGGGAWYCYHRSLGTSYNIQLNSTAAQQPEQIYTSVTSTQFSVSNLTYGDTYLGFVFAHDAGGFGLTGTDNVISCGSYTASGTSTTITLGYEPQWVLIKKYSAAGDNWRLLDTMRGMTVPGSTKYTLAPNTSMAEESWSDAASPSATGFTVNGAGLNDGGDSYIYIAIRRGPMKVPTSGTSVFAPITSSAAAGTALTTGFPIDMQTSAFRSVTNSDNTTVIDRLRGVSTNATQSGQKIITSSTSAEAATTNKSWKWGNTGFTVPTDYGASSTIYYNFQRAPSFFDQVCYTGTGVARTINHNLGVAPELMIVKPRSIAAENWIVYNSSLNTPEQNRLVLNGTFGQLTTPNATWWNSTNPTASVFSVGTPVGVNGSGYTYVAYLFASCPGVSKVGSYTGTGASGNAITTGFAPRFLLIKCTSTTGNWIVFDTARGMGAGSEPYLLLNATGAETAGTDWLDVSSSGFSLNTTGNATNGSGQTYIYLAIA